MAWRPDVAVAIVGTALGLGALIAVPAQIRGQGYGAIADIQSPAFFPILIALLTAALSLLLLASSLHARTRAGAAPPPERQPDDETGPVESPNRLAATVLCLSAYYAALDLVGMIAASVIVLATLALILGFRRYGAIGSIALALPVAIYLGFEKGLFVLLPAGKLF